MSFGQAIAHVFLNYDTFTRRASRSEFWWWILFAAIGTVVTYYLPLPFGFRLGGGVLVLGSGAAAQVILIPVVPMLTVIWFLIITIPTLAVGTRRLHDANKKGWWWLLALVCGIGPLVLIVLWVLPGTKGRNRFGAGPALGY